jgi:hypothetical protein
MYMIRTLALAFYLVVCSLFAFSPAHAQVAIGFSVDVAPPPLPVYDQPPIPAPGYLWVPGYWAWGDDSGYYWVPGTWVLPPEPELLWTPGYWGWSDGVYVFHDGYWGPEIGFYGGVIYGFGYTGVGYEGGYWRNGAFFYNESVNNISNVSITNVYNKTVVVNNVTNVSYNGGPGGTSAQPTAQQLAAADERHVAPTAQQTQNVQAAAKDPTLSLNHNQGHPTVAATTHPAQFNGPGVIAAHPGKPVAAISPQGHTISSPTKAATTPGGQVAPGAATTTAPTTIPGGKVTPGTPGTKVTPGTAATTPGSPVAPDIKKHKGTTGGGTTPGTATTTPPKRQLPARAARPPAPQQVVRPTPPPPSHAATPPPPRAATPPPRAAAAPPPPRPAAPPPRQAAPAAKPKCQPGQHC